MGDKGGEGAEIGLVCKRPFPIQNDKEERGKRGREGANDLESAYEEKS